MAQVEIDVSDSAKEILATIFKNDDEKKQNLEKAIRFVSAIVDGGKIKEYVDEIKKIIKIEKGDGSKFIEAIEILGCIANILVDLYDHLEAIKTVALDKNDREFIKSNIDIVAQVIIVVALDHIEEMNFIEKDVLIKILSFVRIAAAIDINMNIKKCFACFKPSQNQPKTNNARLLSRK